MHTMHEYVVDIAVIPVSLQLNVVSHEKFGKPPKLGMPRRREKKNTKKKEETTITVYDLREEGVDRTINLSVSGEEV